MHEQLGDPALYAAALARIADRERDRDSSEPALLGGPALSALTFQSEELSRRLARLVPSLRYEISPVVPRRALLGGKERVLFHSPPLDVVVLSALATWLSGVLEPAFSPRLFSYRRGRSNLMALTELAAFVKDHRRARPDPKQRGLYVVRRDVKAYGDSIPSGSDSSLWTVLARELAAQRVGLDAESFAWLVRAIRPALAPLQGFDLDPTRGIPTGSPLQPLMGNLYLMDLDRELERIAQGFYARFGDDVLFAHPDAAVAVAVSQRLDAVARGLGLCWGEAKHAELYLTAAGRPSDAATSFKPTRAFKYLGLRVDGRGELGLSDDKASGLLRSASERLRSVHLQCDEMDFETRAGVYCAVINAATDPLHPAAFHAAQLTRYVVSDRGQLHDLDYQLALRVAEHLTGKRGVRAFRRVSMRMLREQYGLRSLVQERNRVDHARRSR